jgi:uncharacterized protein
VSKLLLFILAVIVIYLVLSSLARNRAAKKQSPEAPPVEPMVPCAHCGVNLPRSEALEAAGRFFCSEEHRRLASH